MKKILCDSTDFETYHRTFQTCQSFIRQLNAYDECGGSNETFVKMEFHDDSFTNGELTIILNDEVFVYNVIQLALKYYRGCRDNAVALMEDQFKEEPHDGD